MGFSAVLHGWGELMTAHLHLHVIIPSGGLSLIESANRWKGRWVDLPSGFFLPRRPLRENYKQAFLKRIRQAYRDGKLKLYGKFFELRCESVFEEWIRRLECIEWITYTQPLGRACDESQQGLRRTVGYLARYANRVAISNSRLISLENDIVTFWYKDYKHDPDAGLGKRKKTSLPVLEFMHRFLQHVAPQNFWRIRHYGFLHSPVREKRLAAIREQLGVKKPEGDDQSTPNVDDRDDALDGDADDSAQEWTCRQCGRGKLVITESLPRPCVRDIMAMPLPSLREVQLVFL